MRFPYFSKPLQAIIGLCTVTVLAGLESRAATRTWDGGGTNAGWTTATNWVGDVAPVAGDDLEFPSGAARPSNINNFPAGTTFNSITNSGNSYNVSGSAIALNAGINATNTSLQNTWLISLTLNSNQTITTGNGGVSFYLHGAINLNGKDLTIAGKGLAQMLSVIGGAGGLIKTGTGGLLLYTNNTFSGPVQLNEGGISLYHGNGLGDTNGSTTISSGTTLFANSVTNVSEPLVLYGTLRSSSITAKTWTGPIMLAAAGAVIAVELTAPLTINSLITGSNGFSKTLPGVLTLNSNNTYTGTNTIDDGKLVVNGNQPASLIILTAGTLSGTGTVGIINVSGSSAKTLSPGSSAGILTCSNISLNSSTTFAVELNGTTPGAGYDRLNVNGSVTLSNTALSATLGFPSAISNSFMIIDNDGTEAVTNTFAGLPEGATVNVSGTPFRISYVGGSGNDVVLTQLEPAQQPVLNIARAAVTNVVLSWPMNFTGFILESKTNLNSNVWAVVSPPPVASGTNSVVTNVVSGAEKYYRLRAP